MTAATIETPIAQAAKSILPGLNVLLMGPAGTGKTHAIGTLVDQGVEVFYLALEAGLESLLGYWTDQGKPVPENLHWHVVKAPAADFTSLLEQANDINMLSLEMLSKKVDPNRSKHDQFKSILTALNNFPDDRTGDSFGAVNTWTPKRALVIDGLTGLNNAAMSNVVGGKAVRSQSDWGVAQGLLERLVGMLCNNCPCHFILLAHVERETDPVLGGTKIMVSTLGKALAPKIPALFSDVVLTVREGAKWTWDTANPLADLKTRNLKFASGQMPSFQPIVDKWKSRGGVI